MAGVEVGTAVLTIIPSAQGFGSKLTAQVAPDMAAAGVKSGEVAAKGFGAKFKAGVKNLAAPAAIAAATAGALSFTKDAIAEARESQKVGAVTEQVIKATGGAAKVSADQVGELATAISNKTGIDDEAIQSGSNLLLTFKNVRNEAGEGGKIFDRATQAAVDLGATGFGSITGNSKMLGKALNDPIKGISALSKAGVTFTEQQKKQIKTMTESGNVLGAQKIILGELESQVGGTAEASATMGEKLSTSFGNVKEQIGTALLPVLDDVQAGLVNYVIPALSSTVDWVGRNKDVLVPLAGIVIGAVAAYKGFQIVTSIRPAILAFNAALAANPVGLVIIAVAGLVAGLVILWKRSDTARDIMTRAWLAIKVGALAMALVAVDAFSFLLNGFLSMVELVVKGAAKAFGWVPGLGPKLQSAADNVSHFKDSTNSALNKIKTDLKVKLDTAQAERSAYALNRTMNSVLQDRFIHLTGTVTINGTRYNRGQFAEGGLVVGPGTGTSDSVPIWGSNGEFMMKAAAVKRYGLDFMHAVNGQRLADGGPVGGGSRAQRPMSAGDDRPIVVQLNVDSRTLTSVLLADIRGKRT